jgi:phage terminase small subunit
MAKKQPPEWLGETAKEYYLKHRDGLVSNGILTSATEDSFILLCDLWQRVRKMEGSATTRSYLDTVKAYTSLAKQFRLLPGKGPEIRHGDRPEFEF